MATILIVDDHPANREILVRLLASQGHRMLEASDGEEALAVVRAERPELIITDILMPTMDGYELVRQLRADAALAKIPVIFYTANYHKREAAHLAKSCGVAHILIKPCNLELVIRVVEDALTTPVQSTPPRSQQAFDQEHVRVITDKLSQTADELGVVNHSLAALVDICLQLASQRDPRQLLQQVCRAARDLLGAKYAVVAIGNKDSGDDGWFATSGMDPGVAERLGQPAMRAGMVGSAFTERKASRLINPDGDPTAVGLPPSHPPVHSLLIAPIVSIAHVYGWICLTDKLGAEEFGAEDEQMLTILGAQVGRIYENGSIYVEIEKYAARLEIEIGEHKQADEKVRRLNRVSTVLSGINTLIVRVRDRQELLDGACRIAVEQGNFGIAWIGRLEPETLDIIPVAWAGREAERFVDYKSSADSNLSQGQGRVGRAVRQLKPILDNDITIGPRAENSRTKELIRFGYRSIAVLPLTVDGAAVGSMSLFAKEPNFFTENELKLLSELAGNISFALEHIGKEEKIGRLSRIQAVTSNINSLIVRVSDRQELFNEACRIAVEHGGFGIAWIGTFNPAANKITPIAWSGIDSESFVQSPSRAWSDALTEQSIVGRAIHEKRAVINNDITADAKKSGTLRQEAIRRGYCSIIALPLLVQGAVVGNLSLFARETNFFTEEEVKLLTELTGDISFALEHIAKEEQLQYLAYYDSLTGLPNRTLFLDRLHQQLRARESEPRMVAVILLDLERFRTVNETMGRHGGDELLRQVAQRLEHACEGKENLARVSANAYGVVIRGARDAADIAQAVESRLLTCFREPYTVNGTELRLAVKAGIALFPTDGSDTDTLFRNAEAAVKKAKTYGNRYLFYAAEMNARAAHALSLETRMRKAVEAQQFVLHYQPKVELASGRVCGLEALIRWQDPESGLVPPVHFIPLLEETGLIIEVGQWVIRQALTDYRDWLTLGYDAPRIAVNVSSIQLHQRDFVDTVSKVIADMKTTPQALDIEITESLIMEDIQGNIVKLKALRDLGINIAIDDFGTGYSSLAYLARLPVNALKIDRSFIVPMANDADSMAIVSTIISLGHSLNMKVIAEGVETEEQSNTLKLLRCDEAQGYLFSKPLPGRILETSFLAPTPASHA